MNHLKIILLCAALFSCGEVIIDKDITAPSDVSADCTQDTDCTEAISCQSGACVAGACVYESTPGLSCDDGNVCTEGEVCQEDGSCGGGAEVALDEIGCQSCTCNPEEGLVCTPAEVGAACDDGDCCTTSDVCTACDPSEDFCPDFGLVCSGSMADCDDNDPCTVDACSCDEGAPTCTTSPAEDGTACVDDPAACTQGDQCLSGACTPGDPAVLDDGNSCTLDACEGGVVTHTPTPDAACDDNNACTTTDVCEGDVCVGTGALVCTVPTCATAVACEPAQGCVPVWEPVGTSCDDEDACTELDYCSADHECVGEALCDDENPCTLDSCAPDGTCTNTPDVGAQCDDADLCTQNDVCSDQGSCSGDLVDCSDVEGPCLKAECNPDTGLCNLPEDFGTPCESDDYGCTWDVCQDGQCVHLQRPGQASFPETTGFAEKVLALQDGTFAILVRRIDQKLVLIHADGLGETISTNEIADNVIVVAGLEASSDGDVMLAYTTGTELQLCHIVKWDLSGQEAWNTTLAGACSATSRAGVDSAYPQFLVAGALNDEKAWIGAVSESGNTLFYKPISAELEVPTTIYDARLLTIVDNGNLGYLAAGYVVINDGTSGGWVSFPKRAWAVNVTGNLVVDRQVSWSDPAVDLNAAFISAAKNPYANNSFTLGASLYPSNGTWYVPNMSYLVELNFVESSFGPSASVTAINSVQGGAAIAMEATSTNVVTVGKLETEQANGWIRALNVDKSYTEPAINESFIWFRDLAWFFEDGPGEMVVLGRNNTTPTVRFIQSDGSYCDGTEANLFEQCAGIGILDCQGSCAPEELMNNGVCESYATTYLGNEIDLDCSALSFEGGDCAPATQ